MAIIGALVGGYLSAEARLGLVRRSSSSSIGSTIPFFASLFSPLRDATTTDAAAPHHRSRS